MSDFGMKKIKARFIEEFKTTYQKLMEDLGVDFWEGIRIREEEGTSVVKKDDTKLSPITEANEGSNANDVPRYDETPTPHDHPGALDNPPSLHL